MYVKLSFGDLNIGSWPLILHTPQTLILINIKNRIMLTDVLNPLLGRGNGMEWKL